MLLLLIYPRARGGRGAVTAGWVGVCVFAVRAQPAALDEDAVALDERNN